MFARKYGGRQSRWSLFLVAGILSWAVDVSASAVTPTTPYGSASFFIDIDGLRVHGRQYGAATNAPPLLMVHGLGGYSAVWDNIVDKLAEQHRVLTIDLKGFGYSDAPRDGDYRITTQANLIEAWLDANGIGQVVLVGQSMGGYISHLFAMTRPERVAALLLLSGAIPPEPISRGAFQQWALSYGSNDNLQRFVEMIFGRWTIKRMYMPTVVDKSFITDQLLDKMFMPYQRDGAVHALLTAAHQLLVDPPEEMLHPQPVSMPATVAWGDDDRIASIEIGRAAAVFDPGLEFHLLENAGHNTFWDQPEAVIDLIEAVYAAGATQEVGEAMPVTASTQ